MPSNEYSIPSCINGELKAMGYAPDTSMVTHINEWMAWYTGTDSWYEEPYVTTDNHKRSRNKLSIRPARRVCREWASLIMNEQTEITAESESVNAWLQTFIYDQAFLNNAQGVIERAMSIGTAAWAPWINVQDGAVTQKIRSYDARMTIPLTWDIDGVTECAFASRIVVKGKKADQLMCYVWDEETATYHILCRVFVNGEKVDPTSYGFIDDFDLKIATVPFGIVRPGIENTVEDLSPYGMSIFADAIDAIKAVDLSYDALFNEVELTEAMVFMSDEMLDVRDYKGKRVPVPSTPKQRRFRKIAGQDLKDFYQVASPDIRTAPLKEAFEVALSELGDICGFGQNYFTLTKSGGLKTATEVSADNSALMRNIRKHEHVVEQAIIDIMRASIAIADAHCGQNLGDPGKISVNFDDSIITDTTSAKQMALAEIAALDVPELKAKYLADWCGYAEKDAEAIFGIGQGAKTVEPNPKQDTPMDGADPSAEETF